MILAAAGSDTIQDVTAAILQADANTTNLGAGFGAAYNIRAGANQSTALQVPADDFCNAHTYHNAVNSGSWPTGGGSPNQTSVTVNTVTVTSGSTAISVASGTPFTSAMVGRTITGAGITDGANTGKTVVISAVSPSPGNNATISLPAVATGTPNVTIVETAAPDGSGDGQLALHNSTNAFAPFNGGGLEASPNACVDIGRSSGGKSASNDPSTEFYAFAIDGVMWGTSSNNAPATLTQSQLQGIYNCTYNNWSQVGGAPGPIVRTIPQPASGTGKFFKTNLLGLGSGTLFPATTGPNGPCPAAITIQENQFFDEYHGNNAHGGGIGDATQYPNAIGVYSAGKWAFQASKDTNPSLDLRAGFRPGALTVQQGASTGPVLGVAWNGGHWQLNNYSVVGTTANSNRTETLKTTVGSNVVTLVGRDDTVSNVTTHGTTNPFVLTAAASTFKPSMVGENVKDPQTGITAGSVITSVANDGSSATLSKAATGADGLLNPFTMTTTFHSSDAGTSLSGNTTNITNGTKINAVLSATSAQISVAALATDTTGTDTLFTAGPGQVKAVTFTSTTAGNTTLNAAPGTFDPTPGTGDVGKTIDSPCAYPGQTILTVAGDGSSVTVDPRGAQANCTNQPGNVGFSAVSSGNVLATVGAQAPWPGSRFVYHILDSNQPASVVTMVRKLIGYTDSPGGAKSPLCSSAHDLDNGGSDGIIADNGFLPIQPHTSAGGNTNVSCYKF